MGIVSPTTRREFLKRSFVFSATAALAGCGGGVFNTDYVDPVSGGLSQFLMVGDWGTANGTPDQMNVAQGMQAYAGLHKLNTDALLMLGDNFYDDMPDPLNSPRWQTNFEDMYPKSVFNCEAIAVPGNHDYQNTPTSKVDAEYAYAARGGTRWTMPAHYFRFTWPANNPFITFIALDSNMPNERAQPIPPNPSFYTQTETQRQQQLDWLTATLNEPLTTPFLLVFAHHPLYSNGPHGDNATLIRDWDPLFRQHGVHAYFAGHDHDLQHLEFDGHPTSFVNSGGGGAELNTLRPSEADRGPFQLEAHGFTHLQVRPNLMTIRHLNATGGLLHKFTKTPEGVVTILK